MSSASFAFDCYVKVFNNTSLNIKAKPVTRDLWDQFSLDYPPAIERGTEISPYSCSLGWGFFTHSYLSGLCHLVFKLVSDDGYDPLYINRYYLSRDGVDLEPGDRYSPDVARKDCGYYCVIQVHSDMGMYHSSSTISHPSTDVYQVNIAITDTYDANRPTEVVRHAGNLVLTSGESMTMNGPVLSLGNDDNVYVYSSNGQVLWHTTKGHVKRVEFDKNGQLCFYDDKGNVRHISKEAGPGATLTLTEDGHLVVKQVGLRPIWDSSYDSCVDPE
jgi:hypothetical protein